MISQPKRICLHLTSRGFFSEINNLLSISVYASIKSAALYICQDNFNDLEWSDFFESKLAFISTNEAKEVIPPCWNITDYTHKAFRRANYSLSLRHLIDSKNMLLRKPWTSNIFRLKKEASDELFRVKPEILTSYAKLPPSYGAIHVRRGDKLIHEGDYVSASQYVSTINKQWPEISDILVLTDDETVIEELQAETGKIRFTLIAHNNLNGHVEASFNRLDKGTKKERINRLLAEVSLACNSEFFIGPFKSNVSRFIALNHKSPSQCKSIDGLKEWLPS